MNPFRFGRVAPAEALFLTDDNRGFLATAIDDGRPLLILSAVFLVGCGINPHLVPVVAHDRAGFGGALASFAVAMFASLRYGRASRALWQALAIAGIAGFGTAVGVHQAIGYLNVTHLGPAVVGAAIFANGLALAALGSRAQR